MRHFNVLIVEDIDSMRLLLRQLLEDAVLSFRDGEEVRVRIVGLARNVWEARGELARNRPELVLLDEVLPGESSLDFAEELKREGIPCILLTSMAERAAPVPDGVLGRLSKPGEKGRKQDRELLTQTLALLLESAPLAGLRS